jgi:hypothetical protein
VNWRALYLPVNRNKFKLIPFSASAFRVNIFSDAFLAEAVALVKEVSEVVLVIDVPGG